MNQNSKDTNINIPLKTLSGSKYLLSLINLVLICIAIILFAIIGALYFHSTPNGISAITDSIDFQDNGDEFAADESVENEISGEQIRLKEDYGIIAEKNIFSPERKEWVVKVIEPKKRNIPINKPREKKIPKKNPRKIVLHGVIIAGDIRKALINNPSKGGGRKRTIYIEEGDELEGYKVMSIESDHIKLDWGGEEIVVNLYSK